MANMSYCRNENTLSDIRDVIDNWERDSDGISTSELKARREILKTAIGMVEAIRQHGLLTENGALAEDAESKPDLLLDLWVDEEF